MGEERRRFGLMGYVGADTVVLLLACFVWSVWWKGGFWGGRGWVAFVTVSVFVRVFVTVIVTVIVCVFVTFLCLCVCMVVCGCDCVWCCDCDCLWL